MNRFLRILLALSLVLAGGAGALGPATAAEPPAEAMDCCGSRCPCTPPPGPSGTRLPAGAAAPAAPVAPAEAAPARKAAYREARPIPDAVLALQAREEGGKAEPDGQPRGRDPDLGRHLASLRHFRI